MLNYKVAFGGMIPILSVPYAHSGGKTTLTLHPSGICLIIQLKPSITVSEPSTY